MDGILFEIERDNGDTLYFYDSGRLCASAYSYRIDSWGEIELTETETKKLYLAMKQYFEKEQP